MVIVLKPKQWQLIRALLHEEHPKSVFMLKSKMRSVLGFTVREHQEWVEDRLDPVPSDSDWLDTGQEGWYKNKHHEHTIRLDFYNERKYTMFLLKFSEYINGK